MLRDTNHVVTELTNTIKSLNKTIEELNDIIKEKDKEIIRLKSKKIEIVLILISHLVQMNLKKLLPIEEKNQINQKVHRNFIKNTF